MMALRLWAWGTGLVWRLVSGLSPRIILGGFGAVCVIAYLAFALAHRGARSGGHDADRAQVVATAVATRADVPIYLSGIGTVQAYNSALIRAQVDGQIVALNFRARALPVFPAAAYWRNSTVAPWPPNSPSAQATETRDRALLDNARLDLKRAETLGGQDSIAGQQVDTARALVAQDAATVRNDHALAQFAQVQLGYARITSPIDGVAGIRRIDIGNIVHPSDTGGIVTVSQVQPIAALVTLPDKDLPALKSKLAAGVTAIARDRASGALLDRGLVESLDNQIDVTTGTIKLKARFANRAQSLWPGQAVDVALLVGTERGAVVVPAAATVRGP